MCSTHHYLTLVILFIVFVREIRCDKHYIVPFQDDPCPVSTCHTVSQLFSNNSYSTAEVHNLTLIFQPGNHTLDSNVDIANISLLQMLSNGISTTRIICKNSVRFNIFLVGTVEIGGLSFHGCGESSVTLANNFTLWNSTFEGSERIGTAFMLNETTAVLIKHCTFVSFSQPNQRQLSLEDFSLTDKVLLPSILSNTTSAHLGGAILCSHSNVVIEFCTFQGNEANYGGAIFAELNSTLSILNSKFHHNKGIGVLFNDGSEGGGGGALFVLNSQIELINCKFLNNSLTAYPGFLSKGGVVLALMSRLTIVDSIFLENKVTGNGGGGVIYLSHSSVCNLTHNIFRQNSAHFSGVMHLHSSNSSITKSNFTNNMAYNRSGVIGTAHQSYMEVKNCTFSRNRANNLAGALSVSSSNITLKNVIFRENYVKKIGAVLCVFDQGYVKLSNTTVANNAAGLSVIALYSSSSEFVNLNTFVDNQGSLFSYNSSVRFKGATTFKNSTTTTKTGHSPDTAFQEGGALSAYSSNVIFQESATFIKNSATYGGAIFAVESIIQLDFSRPYSTFLVPQYHNITMTDNTATKTGGGIYLHQSTFKIKDSMCYIIGNTAFNKGGGIHAINSNLKLESSNNNSSASIVMTENKAQRGGGIFMQDYSKLSMDIHGISVQMIKNVADYGAAIFVDDNTAFETCSTTPTNIMPASECFFQILEPYNIMVQPRTNNETEDSTLLFQNNSAKHEGKNLFGGLLDRCTLHATPSSIFETMQSGSNHKENADGLIHFLNISNIHSVKSIASDPVQVCFCSQGSVDCTLRVKDVEVKKGEIFNLSVVAVNQVKSPVKARIFSYLSSQDSELSEGKRARTSTSCTNISFSIISSNKSETLVVFAAGPCKEAEPSTMTVTVTFSPCNCPIGFEQSNARSCECVCNPLIAEYVTDCDVSTESFTKRNQSWISVMNQNNQTTYIVSKRCPFRFCRSASAVRINLNHDKGADAQCSEGHTGINCASCASNYGVSLAHKLCLPCSENWYISLIAVVIGTIIAGLLLVTSILAINFTVAIGTINGFIFYANIIDVYDSIFLPLDSSSFPVIFIEWLDLDPGINGCFLRNIDLYRHIWTRLVFPTYIISIVLVIILISERSLRFSHLIGKRNPIATLATLILLSVTNVLETAVVSLRPATLTYITLNGSWDETVWHADGSIRYLHDKHIPLFLVALLIVLLTIIYITLLTFWQWSPYCQNLWIFKWTKYQKLNLFIQAYQAPYCPRHRYWTGLLLFVRVLLILISIYTEASANDSSVPLVSIVFILGTLFFLKMTCARNLYKRWLVDVLELILLFNLFVFTIFTWYALDDLKMRQILAYLSTILTLLLLLCVIAYHIYVFLIMTSFPKLQEKIAKKFHSQRPVRDTNLQESDRFHDLIGTIELHPAQEALSVPKRSSMSTVPTTVTFSTVDRPNSMKRLNQMIPESTRFHSETPYVPVSSSPISTESAI